MRHLRRGGRRGTAPPREDVKDRDAATARRVEGDREREGGEVCETAPDQADGDRCQGELGQGIHNQYRPTLRRLPALRETYQSRGEEIHIHGTFASFGHLAPFSNVKNGIINVNWTLL